MSDDMWTSMTIADALLPLPNGKKVQQGKSPQCHKEAAPDGQWGVLKTTAIQAGRFEDEHNKLLPNEVSADPSIEVEAGDLLMTCAGPRNRCGVPTLVRKTRPKLLLSGKMYRFRANPQVVLPEYLEGLLLAPTTQRRIDKLKTGISDSGLNLTQSRFLKMQIELPSISAQQSVVDLMASLTSRLDAGQAYAHAGAGRLRLGRISAALELFGRIDGKKTLNNLLTVNIGGVWGSAPGADEVDVDIFRVTELRHGGRLDQSTAAARSVRLTHLKRRELQPGDLLLEKSGGGPKQPVGRVGLVTQVEGRATCSNFMQLMRPDQTQVVPAFLHAYLTAFHESGQTAALQTATTNIRNIKASEYTKLEVPWVPPAEQNVLLQELTDRYDSLARLTDTALLADRRAVSMREALLESLTTSPRR